MDDKTKEMLASILSPDKVRELLDKEGVQDPPETPKYDVQPLSEFTEVIFGRAKDTLLKLSQDKKVNMGALPLILGVMVGILIRSLEMTEKKVGHRIIPDAPGDTPAENIWNGVKLGASVARKMPLAPSEDDDGGDLDE